MILAIVSFPISNEKGLSVIVSAHQPNLFPNNSFWDKMAQVDIYEIAIFDQYSSGMWVSKVNFGEGDKLKKFTIPTTCRNYGEDRICDVLLSPGYQEAVLKAIEDAYYQYPYFAIYFPYIRDLVEGTTYKYLWEFNFAIIRGLKELLKIETPITISSPPPLVNKTYDLVWMVRLYGGTEYVSGIGGKHYIEESEWPSDIKLSYYQGNVEKYSILTRIFKGILTHEAAEEN